MRIKVKRSKVCPQLRRRVIVAMSGGLDSAVAAALLKRAGFDVVGIFMKFWAEPILNYSHGRIRIAGARRAEARFSHANKCCNQDAEGRARKVSAKLGILFYVLNVGKEFKKKVVDYFIKEYKSGRTPNPCVVCNKEIKFRFLLNKALELKADFVATGHYARKSQMANGKWQLLRAKDKDKDQSYFLWKLGQPELKRILFPIGDYTRSEVINLAKKFNLPAVTSIKKSQEVCFVLTDLEKFLRKYIVMEPGPIVEHRRIPTSRELWGKQFHYGASRVMSKKYRVLGAHKGLAFYTIGQRKGIRLAGGPIFAKATAGKPYFVLEKDLKKNILIVTKDEKDLYKKEIIAEDVGWISGKSPKSPLKIKVKIRYRHKPSSATIKLFNHKARIVFDKPQKAITPGQSVVFYKGQEVLGGGIIS